MKCPLCSGCISFFGDYRGRGYLSCRGCGSIMMDPACFPSVDEERARYMLHDNDPDDPNYRSFVLPLVASVLSRFGPGSRGLDYGSGRGSAVAAMLAEAGHWVDTYDPYFDPRAIKGPYDYIALCEVAEHFREPAREFEKIKAHLKGDLFLMTDPYEPTRDFSAWYYKDDETHFFFYSRKALGMVPGFVLLEDEERVFVLRSSR